MQRYTIFFIAVNALHVSGGFSAQHQELKNCTHRIGYMSSLLAATAQCSTCFRRFLCPSSGAQKLYTQHRVYVKLACCYRPMLYMFQAVSPPIIRSSKTVHTASGICQACLLLSPNALHVSGAFSAHHQELKNCTHSIGYMSSLLAAIAQCSTCFRRFLCPSSGAQKLYTQHRVYVKLACCYR